MKTLVVSTMILASTIAQAAPTTTKLSCSFTEPFYTLEVDLVKKEITKIEPDFGSADPGSISKSTIIARGIQVKTNLKDPFLPKLRIADAKGAAILNLQLDGNGSDGMSDLRFPYSALNGKMSGGCKSNLLDVFDPNK